MVLRGLRRLLLCGFLLLAGCDALSGVSLPPILGTPTPQVEPTPVGDTVQFGTARAGYRVTLVPGQRVPGTGLGLISTSDSGYTVEIDALPVQKRAGDSFFWRGVVAPGVMGQYNLFVERNFQPNTLTAAGEVLLTVFSPLPIEGGSPPTSADVLVFDQIIIDYVVPLGRTIPGTSLVFVGAEDRTISFGGTAFYPQRVIGDSLTWSGTLRPNVHADYNLTVVGVERFGLRVRGTAVLHIRSAPLALPSP